MDFLLYIFYSFLITGLKRRESYVEWDILKVEGRSTRELVKLEEIPRDSVGFCLERAQQHFLPSYQTTTTGQGMPKLNSHWAGQRTPLMEERKEKLLFAVQQ